MMSWPLTARSTTGIERPACLASPVDVLFWGNLDVGTALIDRHPDTRFIIDHLGTMQPRVLPAPPVDVHHEG